MNIEIVFNKIHLFEEYRNSFRKVKIFAFYNRRSFDKTS